MSGFQFSNNQKLALIAIIGLCVIGLSVSHFRNNWAGSNGVVIKEPGQDAQVVTNDSDPMPGSRSDYGKVVFQVAGCVNSPGVYSLPAGKRVMDAVAAAGGAKKGADLQAINLAAKIEDGNRIFVPTITMATTAGSAALAASSLSPSLSPSASASASQPSKSSASTGEKFKNPGDGTVNINTAEADELQRLPGVGPSTSQKILEYRQQIGKFATKEQLMDVKGIGPKKLEKMIPFITL